MLNLEILSLLGLYKSPETEYWRFETLGQSCNEIERVFWDAGYFELSKYGVIWPQYVIGPYRVDFALFRNPDAPRLKIAIEIDGHDSHKTKAQRDYDSERERYLQRNGWTVVRFTGVQVYRDSPACVRETVQITNEVLHWLKVR
jgi:very-short-patch-repair endonuclease